MKEKAIVDRHNNKNNGYHLPRSGEQGRADEGQYNIEKRRRASKIQEQQLQDQQIVDSDSQLIHIPWDDDSFSLCLDTFPSAHWAKKFNAYPTTRSPLRKHWNDDESSEEEEDHEEEEEEEITSTSGEIEDKEPSSNSVSTASSSSATSSSIIGDSLSFKTQKKKTGSGKNKSKRSKLSLFFKKNNNGTFPYNNDTNFLNRIDEEINSNSNVSSIAASIIEAEISTNKQKGHVEHISPLSNGAFFSDDLMYRSPIPSTLKKVSSSSSSVRSKLSSIASLPPSQLNNKRSQQLQNHGNSGSVNGDSVISDTCTVESWKIVQSPAMSMTMSPPIVSPTTTTNIRRQQYNPTPSHEYYQFQHLSPSRSNSLTPSSSYIGVSSNNSSGTMSPPIQRQHQQPPPLHYSHSLGSSNSHISSSSYYYAQHGYQQQQQQHLASSPSASHHSITSSYRSIPVPRNADELVYFSNSSSICSTNVGSEYTEKSRSYSQFFNPGYHSGNKKNRSTSPHQGGRRSGSLLAKLVRNIKHHFGKQ